MLRPFRKTLPRKLRCEQLEARCVLSSVAGGDDFHAVIVAGDPSGVPADSPADRVDANTADSPFAGVGSLRIDTRRGTYICTATPIDATRVLTAAHCVDLNNDGRSNSKDGITSIQFQLNLDTDAPGDQIDHSVPAAYWTTHPDFTGFARPSVNDDLAVVTLTEALPAAVPIYALATTPLTAGSHIYLVGYGQSGDGVNGYTVGASWTTKRSGENHTDAFYGQDDGGKPAGDEVFRFDFDGPNGNGSLGGPTLGNDRETTLGGGDSGGPSFVLIPGSDPSLASSYELIGVNTFTQGLNAPKFGSLGGGIHLVPYADWLATAGETPPPTDSGPGGGGKGPKPKNAAGIHVVTLPPTVLDLAPHGDSAWSVTTVTSGGVRTEIDLRDEVDTQLGAISVDTIAPAVTPTADRDLIERTAEDSDDLLAEALESVLEERHSAAIDRLDGFSR